MERVFADTAIAAIPADAKRIKLPHMAEQHSTSIAVTVPVELLTAIDNLAKLQDRDRSSLINQALRQFLEIHTSQVAYIAEQLRTVETQSTPLVPYEEAIARVKNRMND